MLICPVCGNTDFTGIDTSRTFSCPVAGCDGRITVGEPLRRVPVAARPQGATASWMNKWTPPAPSSAAPAPDASGLRFRRLEEGGVEVSGSDSLRAEHLVIPDRWNGEAVTSIAPSAFAHNARLRTVVLPEALEVIGHHAFFCCPRLTQVTMGGSLQLVDAMAFAECTALAHLALTVPPLAVMPGAFSGCVQLSASELARVAGT